MKFLNNTKLIFKSILDLIPAVLVAIIVAMIAAYGMNNLNKNFREINEIQLEITNTLEAAKSHLRSLKIAVTGDVLLATKQNSLDLLEKAQETVQQNQIDFQTKFSQIFSIVLNQTDYSNYVDNSGNFDNNTITAKHIHNKDILDELIIIRDTLDEKLYSQLEGVFYNAEKVIQIENNTKKIKENLDEQHFKTSNILIKAIKASFNTTESFELREDADMRNFVYRYSMFLTSLSGKFSTMKQNEYKLFAIEAEDSNQPNKRLQKENPYYIDQSKSNSNTSDNREDLIKEIKINIRDIREEFKSLRELEKSLDHRIPYFFSGDSIISQKEKLIVSDDIWKSFTKYSINFNNFASDFGSGNSANLSNSKSALDNALKNNIYLPYASISTRLDNLIRKNNEEIEKSIESNEEYLERLIYTIILVSVIGLLLAIGIGYLEAIYAVVRPMREFAKVSMEIAQTGDFSQTIDIQNKDCLLYTSPSPRDV